MSDETGADERIPPYRRIADELRQRITRGQLRVGQKMPSYNKIARIHDVALSTAQKAIGVLRDEGLVQSINGQATYVIATTPHNHTDVVGMFTDLNRRIDTLEKTVRDLQKIMNPRTREPARSNRSQHG